MHWASSPPGSQTMTGPERRQQLRPGYPTGKNTSMSDAPARPPANVTEFNTIAGMVFAQLYAQFPSPLISIGKLSLTRLGCRQPTGPPTSYPRESPSRTYLRERLVGSSTRTTSFRYRRRPAYRKGIGSSQCCPKRAIGHSWIIACAGDQRDRTKGLVSGWRYDRRLREKHGRVLTLRKARDRSPAPCPSGQ
jgi:hypothetical protein